ncbi:MAG TPA: PEGA domain-containing protein [Polyangia bacterium]|jgi:TolB-like protein
MRYSIVSVALLLAGLAGAPPAAAQPGAAPAKIAVLVLQVGEADAELADNLTEVLIAELAKKGGFDIAGKEEFRSKLGVAGEQGASSCLEQPTCLGRVGTALGVSRVAAGTIGKRGADYAFNLNLIDIATARVENRIFKVVSGGVAGLITTLQDAARQLLAPKVEPGALKISTPAARRARVYVDDAFVGTTPVRAAGLEAGTHRLRVERDGHHPLAREIEVPGGATLDMELSLAQLPARRVWPAWTAWSTFGAAVVTGATGIFFGVLSQEHPSGNTRVAVLDDVNRKRNQALTANVLFGSAGALALTSATVFVLYRRDVFAGGAAAEGRVARRPGLRLLAAPAAGGGSVAGIIQF